MAMIGRNAAVAEVGAHRHEVDGPLAFAAWLGVHAMLLSGVHSRTDAFLSWAWDYFERDHAATVESHDAPRRIAWGDDADDVPAHRPRTRRTHGLTRSGTLVLRPGPVAWPDVGERPVWHGSSAVEHQSATPRSSAPSVVRRRRAGVGLVARGELVDALDGSPARVVAIVAGPGYGKSAVLGQWADRLAGAAVWHTCTDADNDPAALLTALGARGRRGTGHRHRRRPRAGPPPGPGAHAARRRRARRSPRPASLNVLTDVIDRLPDTWRVGVTSRARPRLPIARLRAAGDLLELGSPSCRSVRTRPRRCSPGRASRSRRPRRPSCCDRTEGWPVARVARRRWRCARAGTPTALASRATTCSCASTCAPRCSPGCGARDTALLVRCSILDELSGPLCDAVLRARSSGAALEHLAAHGVIAAGRTATATASGATPSCATC